MIALYRRLAPTMLTIAMAALVLGFASVSFIA